VTLSGSLATIVVWPVYVWPFATGEGKPLHLQVGCVTFNDICAPGGTLKMTATAAWASWTSWNEVGVSLGRPVESKYQTVVPAGCKTSIVPPTTLVHEPRGRATTCTMPLVVSSGGVAWPRIDSSIPNACMSAVTLGR
jgi:hypothetical protein